VKNSLRKIISLAIIILFTTALILPQISYAYVSVKGYYKSNGTYVAPYVRSNPNGLKYDNYSYTPSQGLYNKTYGTRGAEWDTPTYITDPNYYQGKALYESGSSGVNVNTYGNSYNSTSVSAPANSYVSGTSWYCNSGYKTIFDNSFNKIRCEKVLAPTNAYISGSDWYCISGYKTIYSNSFQKTSCQQVVAPANAYVSGSDWYCITGYKTIYDNSFQKVSCQQVFAPANAYVSGSDWYCNSGYKTIYSNSFQKVGCQQVIAPANAYVSGSDWYCNSGYKTIYNNNFAKTSCQLK